MEVMIVLMISIGVVFSVAFVLKVVGRYSSVSAAILGE